jgi:hypothetical protein
MRGRDPSADPGARTGEGGRTPPLGIPGLGRNALNPFTVFKYADAMPPARDRHPAPVHGQLVRLPHRFHLPRLDGLVTDNHYLVFTCPRALRSRRGPQKPPTETVYA